MPPNPDLEVRFFALRGHLDRAHYLKFGNRLVLMVFAPLVAGFYLILAYDGDNDPTGQMLTLGGVLVAASAVFVLVMSAIFLYRRRLPAEPGVADVKTAGVSGKLNLILSRSLIAVIALIAVIVGLSALLQDDYSVNMQVSEAVEFGVDAKTGLAEYYQNNDKWPAALGDVYDPGKTASKLGKYTDHLQGLGRDKTYVVRAVIRSDGAANKRIAGKSVVFWTTDGGNTWHCGTTGILGLSGTVEHKYLSPNCRD